MMDAPSRKSLLEGEIKFIAEQLKKKGKSIAEALSKARAENTRFEAELGESLPEREWREVVQEVYGTAPRKLFLSTSVMSKVAVTALNWAVDHVLLAGALNLFVGDPDIGKTLVAIFYIAKLSREGKKSVVICREDDYGFVWVPRLSAAGADLDFVIPVHGVSAEGESDLIPWMLDNPEHLTLLKELLLKENPAICLIDPLADFAGSKDLNKQGDVREITRPLNSIAEETRTAILANCHTTKAIVDSVIKTAAGSYQLMAAVAIAWYFMKDPDNQGQRLMLQARNKYGKKRGFKYSVVGVPYPGDWPGEKDEDGIGVVEFKGKETRTADELLERNQDAENGVKTRVRRWLNEMLANGPVPTQQAGEEMRTRGFNVSTVTGVCIEMGISRDGKTWEMKSVSRIPKQEEIFDGVKQ
jgi:hypothetical protein